MRESFASVNRRITQCLRYWLVELLIPLERDCGFNLPLALTLSKIPGSAKPSVNKFNQTMNKTFLLTDL